MNTEKKLGLSGSLARRFQDSKITPLLALTGILMGFFAIIVTPREEEPQINVTFANIFIPFPGASAVEVENLVAVPMEQVLAEIEGVKHTYSVSRPGMAVLTIQFKVGEERTAAIMAHTPMNRFGEAEELAGATVWLASERASGFVTGAVVRVDGGFTAMTI
jgi:hypothetical protein